MTPVSPPPAALAISGPIRAGKTTLAESLLQDVPVTLVRTRDVLLRERARSRERRELQQLGRALDNATDGRWVLEAAEAAYEEDGRLLIVDAVRILLQIAALKRSFRVVHVHLTAPLPVLRARWDATGRTPPYDELRADPTEGQVESLRRNADLVVDTAIHDAAETAAATLEVIRAVNA